MTSAGARVDRAIAGGVALAGVATFISFNLASRSAAFPLPDDPVSFGLATSRPPAPGFRARALHALALAPLDQRAFNAWYVYRANDGATPSRDRAAGVVQLARLGWRNTPAQFNLLYAYAIDEDATNALRRADALLRRNVSAGQMFAILWSIEQSGQARAQLAGLLARGPAWRSPFLRGGAGLATPVAVAARVATINDLARDGVSLTRGEVAPTLRRLVALGDVPGAYALWRRTRGIPVRDGLFDPDFVVAAQTEASGGALEEVPFEWTTDRGNETSVDFDGRSGAGPGEVRIRWSGLGVPTVLRQTFRAVPGRYALRITGFDARPGLLSRLRFSVRCPGATVQFARPVGTSASAVVLAGDGVVACDFPTFLATVNVDDAQGRFDVNLSGLRLYRL